MNSAALRAQVESSLGEKRFTSPFAYQAPDSPEMISTGVAALDRLMGGLPRGSLTEICGPESSGCTALLLSILAEAAANGELCALLDGQDALDPCSAAAAGVNLNRLLWVRCHRLEQALRAAELLFEGGGFGVAAIDLVGVPARLMRRIPLSVWFRLRRMVRDTSTALIVLEREPTAGTSASLVVRLDPESIQWSIGRGVGLAVFGCVQDLDRARQDAWVSSSRREGFGGTSARLLSGFRSNAEALQSRRMAQPGARATLRAQALWR